MKYLVKGMAVMAFYAVLTSCSHDIDLGGGVQENIQQTYEEAFATRFGEPASTLDWGFGESAATRALTRTNEGDTYAQTHGDENGGCNMNHNEWADPNKDFGGWVVPDPLTARQKEIVTAYFQNNTVGYEDPHYRHFFVQQVYTGGTETKGLTKEGITDANGTTYSATSMNLLTVGAAHTHINDFNAGTCSTSAVLDNGQTVGGSSHNDEITLMVNIDDTSCFGYHETASSTHHDNKAGLAGWETIAAWAVNHGYSDAYTILNDKWNRSFLGFDLALQEGEQAYAKDDAGNVIYADYTQAPESPEYAWDGEKVVRITTGEWEKITIEHQYWTETKDVPVYKDEYKTIQNIGWLSTNQNFYVAADKVTLDQSYSINRAQLSSLTEVPNAVILKEVMDGSDWYQSVINLPRINQLVADGYLPVKDKSLQNWVKVGTSDGYYSDWIVTLTKAKRITDDGDDNDDDDDDDDDTSTETESLRVIAEDLTVSQSTDFDFNDVVFDVIWTKTYTGKGESKTLTSQNVKVILQAAGGTLPLYVAGHEVHEEFGEDTSVMINTHAKAKGYRGKDDAEPVEIPLDDSQWSGSTIGEIANSVEVYVKKTINGVETDCPLTAPVGEVASKVAVGTDYDWCDERQDIDEKYSLSDGTSLFKDYVKGLRGEKWYMDFNKK